MWPVILKAKTTLVETKWPRITWLLQWGQQHCSLSNLFQMEAKLLNYQQRLQGRTERPDQTRECVHIPAWLARGSPRWRSCCTKAGPKRARFICAFWQQTINIHSTSSASAGQQFCTDHVSLILWKRTSKLLLKTQWIPTAAPLPKRLPCPTRHQVFVLGNPRWLLLISFFFLDVYKQFSGCSTVSLRC